MAVYAKNASLAVKLIMNNPAGLKYPIADGTANQVIKTDGSGTLSFLTTVNSVTGSAPVVSSGGATPAISMAAATTSANGYLTSTDWNTFNSKAPTASPTFTGSPILTSAGGGLITVTPVSTASNFTLTVPAVTDTLITAGSPTFTGTVKTATTISVGGATPSASGAGITFPATQSASSDANTLDDYEEGTWTPNVGGNATYSIQAGTYTKVGNIVTAWFDIQINVLGTGSTGSISGLPYISRISPSNPQGMAGIVGYFENIATASTLILVRVDNNTTTAALSNTAGVTTNVLGNAIYGNSARTTGTIIYQANA
jgi:hypothetical protein